jgi:hypothetical protein
MEKTAASKIPEELVSKITLMAYQMSPHPLATILVEEFNDDDLRRMEYSIRIGWDRDYVFSLNGAEHTRRKFKFLEMMEAEEVIEGWGWFPSQRK